MKDKSYVVNVLLCVDFRNENGTSDMVMVNQFNSTFVNTWKKNPASGVKANKIDTTLDPEDINNRVLAKTYDVIICSEEIHGEKIGLGSVKRWREADPKLQIFLILDPSKKAQAKVSGLWTNAYYNGLFYEDFTITNICNLLLNPRTKEEAFDYYGLKDFVKQNRTAETQKQEKMPENDPDTPFMGFMQKKENTGSASTSEPDMKIRQTEPLRTEEMNPFGKPQSSQPYVETTGQPESFGSFFSDEKPEEKPERGMETQMGDFFENFNDKNDTGTVGISEEPIPVSDKDDKEDALNSDFFENEAIEKEKPVMTEKEPDADISQTVDSQTSAFPANVSQAGFGNLIAYNCRIATLINDTALIIDNPAGGFKNFSANTKVVLLVMEN